MDRKMTLFMFAIVAALAVVAMQPASHAGSGTMSGYLSDVMCATKGVSAGGADLINNPEKHTVACMKMPPCEGSGYGIFLKNASGKYAFFKFDDKGTAMAKKVLDNTSRSDGMSIEVHGTVADGMVMVERVVEA